MTEFSHSFNDELPYELEGTRDELRRAYEDISDAIEFAHRVQREAVLEAANDIDPRLHDEFVRMLGEDDYSSSELSEIIKTIDAAKASDVEAHIADGLGRHVQAEDSGDDKPDRVSQLMQPKFNELYDHPDRKKERRRQNKEAFLRGLGGVGAGMAAIGDGMAAGIAKLSSRRRNK